MKSTNGIPATAVASEALLGGRVHRRRNIENEEIQVYLARLKELVPFMPRNRKLSKLEVIQYVIDYICDLQEALETPQVVLRPAGGPQAVAAALAASPRQPLGVLAPNTLVPTSCSTQEASSAPVHLLEKVPPPTDTRPVSC